MAELQGQTVVVIGGSSGIGLATARRARAEGAEVIITGRDPQRLHQWLPVAVAQHIAGRVRPGGAMLFMTGTDARRPGPGQALMAAGTAALPALAANLAVELAPILAAGSGWTIRVTGAARRPEDPAPAYLPSHP